MNFKNYCKLKEEEMPQETPQTDQGGGEDGWASQLAQAAASFPQYVLQQSIDQLNTFDPQQVLARIQQKQQDQQSPQQAPQDQQRFPQGHPQQTPQNQQASPNWVGQQPGMN